METDARLLEDCLSARSGAWERLVGCFGPYLLRVCRNTLARAGRPSGPQEAQDMLQEVFLCFLENDLKVLRNYRGLSSLRSYLAGVAVYRVLNDRGWDARSLPLTTEDPSSDRPGPPEALLAAEQGEHLQRELGRLPPQARLALSLQGRGASLREVGLALGVSEAAAAKLVSRARASLRERL